MFGRTNDADSAVCELVGPTDRVYSRERSHQTTEGHALLKVCTVKINIYVLHAGCGFELTVPENAINTIYPLSSRTFGA